MTYTQFIPYTDRLDYLAPLANNVAYALAVEKLLGIHDKLPPRCQYIRVICCGTGAHFVASARPRRVRDGRGRVDGLSAHVHRARKNLQSVRIAHRRAVHDELHAHRRAFRATSRPAGATPCRKFLNEVVVNIDEMETLLTRNRIWVDRTRDVGVISKEEAIDYGLSGPNLRGSGVDYDLRKAQPYLCYQDLEFDVPVGSTGDCYDRYLVRMEEMRQSVRILQQCLDKIPGGPDNPSKEPVNVADGKIVLPPKDKVLSGMEELIHQFMLVTEGRECAARRSLFRPRKSEGRTRLLHQQQGRRHAVPAEDPLAPAL